MGCDGVDAVRPAAVILVRLGIETATSSKWGDM